MSVKVGFIHAGEASRAATAAAVEARGRTADVVHLTDPMLVDPHADEFPITDERFAAIKLRAEELARDVDRIVLSCSVYNGVAQWLAEELCMTIERSDEAGARRLQGASGSVGVLISYKPSFPIVADYVAEVLAEDEVPREVRTSLAPDAFALAGDPDRYRAALVAALAPLRGSDTLFIAQYSMNAHAAALREAWGAGHVVSALEATLDEVLA